MLLLSALLVSLTASFGNPILHFANVITELKSSLFEDDMPTEDR
jgi:hypothetical protein